MADPRGYVEIQLSTGQHRLRFTKWDVAEFELQTGKTIHQLFGKVEQHFGLRECMIALAIGLAHEAPEITPRKVADLMSGTVHEYFDAVAEAIRPHLADPEAPKGDASADPLSGTPTGENAS